MKLRLFASANFQYIELYSILYFERYIIWSIFFVSNNDWRFNRLRSKTFVFLSQKISQQNWSRQTRNLQKDKKSHAPLLGQPKVIGPWSKSESLTSEKWKHQLYRCSTLQPKLQLSQCRAAIHEDSRNARLCLLNSCPTNYSTDQPRPHIHLHMKRERGKEAKNKILREDEGRCSNGSCFHFWTLHSRSRKRHVTSSLNSKTRRNFNFFLPAAQIFQNPSRGVRWGGEVSLLRSWN